MFVKNYDGAGNVTIYCQHCDQNFVYSLSETIGKNDFDEWENPVAKCPNTDCPEYVLINVNILEDEYTETEIEKKYMPFAEINARKQIRDLMWNHRADLKGKDRTAYNQMRKQELENKITEILNEPFPGMQTKGVSAGGSTTS